MANPVENIEKGHERSGDYLHPQYKSVQMQNNNLRSGETVGLWDIMIDCYAGQSAIKARGVDYLPMTPGQLAEMDLSRQTEMYRHYLRRADFPEVLSEIVTSMQGMIYATPPQYELPGVMEDLLGRATPDLFPLDLLTRETTAAQLTTSRIGLLIDPQDGDGIVCPLICRYREKTILDWAVDNNGDLFYVLLDESDYVFDAATCKHTWKDRFRVLTKDENGTYCNYVTDNVGNVTLASLPADVNYPMVGGKVLDRIPFFFINATDVSPSVSIPMLLPVALLALSAYCVSADYKQALYFTSEPTPVVIGGRVDGTLRFGSNSIINLPDKGSDAKYLEFSGAGVAKMREAVVDSLDSARRFGVELVDNGAESGTALNTRLTIKTASLMNVVLTCETGLTNCLPTMAEWCGYNPEDVKVQLNHDFQKDTLVATDLVGLAGLVDKGMLSPYDFHKLLLDNGFTTTKDYDEWYEECEQGKARMPSFSGITQGVGGDENGGQEEEEGNGKNGEELPRV